MKEQHIRNRNKKTNFTRISCLAIEILQLMIFGYVWIFYYNTFAFRTHRITGGIISLLLYYILYGRLTRIYRANKIAHYSIGEIVFSQLLAFGITDLIFYVECCFIARRYVSIVPGLFTVVIQFLAACIWALLAKRYYMNHISPQDTVVIYGDESVKGFLRKMEERPSHLFNINKKISSGEKTEKLYAAIDAAEVVILYQTDYQLREELMHYCINQKKVFYVTPTITDIIASGFENRHFIDSPLMKYDCYRESLSMEFIKRSIDIVVSLFGLIISLPITLVTMLAIKLEDGGTIFFKQERYTKNWKKFKILKFRSMVMNAEENGALLCSANDSRITKVGAVIRRFRIDEIPQLLNVLKGDMSLVGPRPERVENTEKYTEELPQFAYRLQVKSGLTGYAQLYGKYNTSAYDKLRLDLIYIENRSLILDMKLIMLTLKILFIPESTEGFSEEAVQLMRVEVDKRQAV
ncbi:MAG: exopolysaccharide biosynthesis polyprenyl glycosylphosphotransferase [Muribaculaceae bacterium]|nr:exopolysaccharide biosynthesis polyprenyl glycosylphosphotransferase [Muribaculaceae bacterium]